jgi:dihydrofolate reductase
LIAAVGRNLAIGKDNQLLWSLPEDMKFFKETTQGATVIMGRKTWESLPPRFRPLPGRRNLVITRQRDYQAPGAETFNDLLPALEVASSDAAVFVIGGAELYALALPYAQRLVLTEVDSAPEADAFFPAFSRDEWVETARVSPESSQGPAFAFVTYERR